MIFYNIGSRSHCNKKFYYGNLQHFQVNIVKQNYHGNRVYLLFLELNAINYHGI